MGAMLLLMTGFHSLFRHIRGGGYRTLHLAIMMFFFFSGAANASPQCYAFEQIEAEQWLRLHSELMVITVTCREGSAGEPLPSAYGKFTKNNIGVLRNAEAAIMAYYHGQGKNGQEQLDKLRTRLGNEYGQKIAELSAPVFCQMYRDKVLRLCTAPHDVVMQEVIDLEEKFGTSTKSCTPVK